MNPIKQVANLAQKGIIKMKQAPQFVKVVGEAPIKMEQAPQLAKVVGQELILDMPR